jgi:hypothetical protein
MEWGSVGHAVKTDAARTAERIACWGQKLGRSMPHFRDWKGDPIAGIGSLLNDGG